ncbi:MAG: hypothetical protein EAX96_12550 [Candidatus Lokiarchaeota archaeon]|nr:hypothetical protein [Candidatus Lokiarchaeota archaeon]
MSVKFRISSTIYIIDVIITIITYVITNIMVPLLGFSSIDTYIAMAIIIFLIFGALMSFVNIKEGKVVEYQTYTPSQGSQSHTGITLGGTGTGILLGIIVIFLSIFFITSDENMALAWIPVPYIFVGIISIIAGILHYFETHS